VTEFAGGGTDLPFVPDGAVAVHIQGPDRPLIVSSVVVQDRADAQIPDAVVIQVSGRGQGTAEVVIVVQKPAEPTGGGVDLQLGLDRPVRIHEQDPRGATIGVAHRPDGEIRNAIAVQIPRSSDRTAEQIVGPQRSTESAGVLSDLLLGLDGPIRIHEQDPHGPFFFPIGAGVLRRSNGQILNTVAVHIG